MKKIAFQNFRRFQQFPTLELGGISIMVGRNNSGKSTMVKALLLILDYLQNQQYDSFSFTNQVLEEANIVTFGRALNNKSEQNEIAFQFDINEFSFSIYITGDNDDTLAKVEKIRLINKGKSLLIEINYSEKFVYINKENKIDAERAKDNDIQIKTNLEIEIEYLEHEISDSKFKKSSTEGLRLLDNLNKLKQRLDKLNELKEEDYGEGVNFTELFIDKSYPIKDNILENMTENSILEEIISDYFYQNNISYREYISKEDKDELEEPSFDDYYMSNIEDNRKDILNIVNTFITYIRSIKIYYLGVNPSKQSALFSLRDKQNNLAQAIHDFKQSKILKGETEYDFVKYWMKEFEVGEDFHIEFYAGEAYEFYVFDKERNKAHLADKGMGSLQAMMLILRVATIMRKHKNTLKYVTIIVEEPELNLHPALQSKLASFFHTVNTEYGIEFIIETHSEYLIRKAQLFVAENQYTDQAGLNPNPFKVHYFDIDNGPYEMNYRNDGRFTNEFGTGFFDVNSNLIFDLP